MIPHNQKKTLTMPIFILFILPYISHHLQVNSQSPSSAEQAILLSLKQHWNDPPSLDSWPPNASLSHWPLVEVDATSGAVTDLYLSRSNIRGTIPTSICHLKYLSGIDLSQNEISGSLPVCLYNIPGLQRLDMSSNALSGEIPGEFSLMTNLVWLDLSVNSLSGTIPWGLFGMQQLFSLSLGYNNLSGKLPEQLTFSSLRVLNLTHNRLRGTILKSIGVLSNLSTLDLSDNRLHGDVVEMIPRLSSIGTLKLCSNRFSGKIPYEFLNKSIYDNCLDSSNLCSDSAAEGLQSCSSSLCSDNIFHGYVKCNSTSHPKKKKSHESKILIYVLGVGFGVAGFAIFYLLARKREIIGTTIKKIWCPDDPPANEEWNMISFQKSKLNKTEIITGLTEENLIGNGGSGKVYRVPINENSGFVAVKSMSNSTKSDNRLEKEFLAEIRTLGVIRHYNIVKLLSYIAGSEVKLLVYQYFENKSLDQWLHGNSSGRKLDWPMRLNIAIGAAEGLCYMHHYCSPPIIHRDIKPSNILLDSEFNAKIADFGLAKLINGRGETETASAVAGTFGYMAPEYAYRSKVNRKSDVYSFGVVLLELTTGRKAVSRGDDGNLAEWAQLQIRDPSVIFDGVDYEIKESIYVDQITSVFRLGAICTAKSPSNRPSMKDCLRILHPVNEYTAADEQRQPESV